MNTVHENINKRLGTVALATWEMGGRADHVLRPVQTKSYQDPISTTTKTPGYGCTCNQNRKPK
jgi:hypothetical protein